MNRITETVEEVQVVVETTPRRPVQLYVIEMCMDFLNLNEVMVFRRVDLSTRSLVTGPRIWDRAAIIQERREKQGKRTVLFDQYLMSHAQADTFPKSKFYK